MEVNKNEKIESMKNGDVKETREVTLIDNLNSSYQENINSCDNNIDPCNVNDKLDENVIEKIINDNGSNSIEICKLKGGKNVIYTSASKKQKEKERVNDKKIKKIATIILFILIVEVLALTYFLGTNKQIFNGVYVEDISLGGLTRKEAQKVLEEKLTSKVINKNITFYYGDYSKEVPLNSLIESLDYMKLAREAQQVGRRGNIFERFMQCINIKRNRYEVNLKFTVNMSALRDIVYSMKYEIDRKAADSTCTKEHGKDFKITPAVSGIDMNVAKTIDYFREIIESNEFEDYDYKLKIIVSEILPLRHNDYYESYSTLLSNYMTEFRRSDAERLKKLNASASKLDKYLLMPGDTFSFNEVVGYTDDSKSKSKKDGVAKDIASDASNEENLEVNVQLATTLYNAVLLANLPVVERTNCMLCPSYVDVGRDALVSGKNVDLKFKNNTTNPIYIEAYVNNGKAYVKLYGNENFKEYDQISFRHKITKIMPPLDDVITIDDKLEPEVKIVTSEGKSGYVVELYGVYKKQGAKDKEKKISESKYMPTATRISLGPEKKIEDDISDDEQNSEDIVIGNVEVDKE